MGLPPEATHVAQEVPFVDIYMFFVHSSIFLLSMYFHSTIFSKMCPILINYD
jgi:hypothetical protein